MTKLKDVINGDTTMGDTDPRKQRIQEAHKWRVLKQLGKGQFGVAYLIDNCYEDAKVESCVAKVVTLDFLGDKDREQAGQEVELLRSLNHPYIVAYHNHFQTDSPIRELTILMEFCDGGELRNKIRAQAAAQQHIPEKTIMRWFLQLVLALQYIHSRYVLHRDLKSSNVFLRNKDQDALIGDFGISRVLEGTIDACATVIGTPYYMSPEVCRSEPYSYRSDIWALGCVLYEMCMLKHAFESENLLGLVYKIVSDTHDPIPKIYTPELNLLINKCLEKSAHARPDSSDLMSEPIVQKNLTDEMYEKQRSCLEQNKSGAADISEKHRAPGAPETGSGLGSTSSGGLGSTNAGMTSPGYRAKAPSLAPPPPGRGRAPTSPGGPSLSKPGVSSVGGSAPSAGPGKQAISDNKLYFYHIMARVKANVVRQRVNWLQVFAMCDKTKQGLLNEEDFSRSMSAMHLGLSSNEILELFKNLSSNGVVLLKTFGDHLLQIPEQIKESENWGYERLAEMIKVSSSSTQGIQTGSRVRVQGLRSALHLNNLEGIVQGWDAMACRWVIKLSNGETKSIKDANLVAVADNLGVTQRANKIGASRDSSALYRRMCGDDPSGVLEEGKFLNVIGELLPRLTEKEKCILFYLSPKNTNGFVDVRGLLSIVSDRNSRRPPSLDEMSSPDPMSPSNRNRPSGLPGGLLGEKNNNNGGPPPPPMASPNPGLGRSLGNSTGAATADIALFRLHRKCKFHRVSMKNILPLFIENKEKMNESELLELVSVVPTGLSRVEMQKVLNYLESRHKVVSLEIFDNAVQSHNSYNSNEDIAFERIQFGKLLQELRKSDNKDIGVVSPQDFRMILMQTEGYLASSELEFILSITDKDGDGNIEYISFIQHHDVRGGKNRLHEVPKWLPRVNIVRCVCYPSLSPVTVNEVLRERLRQRLKGRGVHLTSCFRYLMPPEETNTISVELLGKVLGMFPLGLSLAEAAGFAYFL